MNYFKISLGIFLALAASRFIPHPPNFTSLIALSFYVPAILGMRFIPALLISLFFTDIILGMHNTIFFTWGSILFIGLLPRIFKGSIFKRISGSIFGVLVFYILTNFGIWTIGMYGYTLTGLITSYVLAIPFFGYTLISTILFSTLIECTLKFSEINFNKKII